MRIPVIVAAAACLAVAAAPQAIAQSIEFGPGGVRVNPLTPEVREREVIEGVTPRQARAIARGPTPWGSAPSAMSAG